MKYLFTIANKGLALLLFIWLLGHESFAQRTTLSPYSRYGIGLLNPVRSNANFGAGGIGYAWRPMNYKPNIYDSLARSDAKLNDRSTNYISLKNPAAFSNYSLTTFEAGAFAESAIMTSGSQSQTQNSAYLSHVTLAFPIGEKWGMGFGIRPYSKLGYNYSQATALQNNQAYSNVYEGDGGLNQIFVGASMQISRNIALGVSGNYLFGTLSDIRRVVYDRNTTANFFNTLDQSELRVSDFTVDFGIQYFKNVGKKYRLVTGITASPVSQLSANSFRLIRNYTGDANFENFKDTILNIDNRSTDVEIGATFGGGISIERKGKWMIGLDYTLNQRKEEDVAPNVTLGPGSEVNLGFESFNDLSAFGSYFKQMGYRAGLRYNSSLMTINNEDIQEFGISFGVAMPLRKSYSTLNLGMEVGRRGTEKAGLTQEDFFSIQLGITINDRWFIQRKYD